MNVRTDLMRQRSVGKVKREQSGHGNVEFLKDGVSRIKHLNKKVAKLVSFDADAIFKSKEWPYY